MQNQRESLKEQFHAATTGYSNELCHSFDFFKLNYPEYLENCLRLTKLKLENEEHEKEFIEEEEEDCIEEEEEEFVEEEEEEFVEEEEYIEKQEQIDDEVKNIIIESLDEDNWNEIEENESSEHDEVKIGEKDEEYDGSGIEDKTKQFPEWFLEKLYPAKLSRFFVDLLHLRKYINSPQIEHFPYPDCHEIALPILKYIFTLLHTVEGAETILSVDENGKEVPISFSYMTRAQKISQVRFFRFELERPLPYSFHPRNPNPLFMHHIFKTTLRFSEIDILFSRIYELPPDMQLYFLAIVFWMYKSPHYDVLHLHSLIICLVVLRTIDSRIPPERNIKAFHKRFDKIIKRERQVRDKEFLETGKSRSIRSDLLTLSVPERMQHVPKSDCFLVQERLLKHFHMQEVFKKKYDQFSTVVLHGFSEFQSVLFQLYGLNSLLNFPYEATKMGKTFCGVFLYNMYDLLRARADIAYYVQHNIFQDSPLMYDFYNFLFKWCLDFLPSWKQEKAQVTISKKALKKQRQLEKRKAAKQTTFVLDPNGTMLSDTGENEQDTFVDLNNKFCALLKVY